tara:strand:+ start:220 stop:474 length:255 start_codon:yes stop_codon:yes gene_type:complete
LRSGLVVGVFTQPAIARNLYVQKVIIGELVIGWALVDPALAKVMDGGASATTTELATTSYTITFCRGCSIKTPGMHLETRYIRS